MSFRRWAELFPAAVDVCPIQLPGRANRGLEPPLHTMSEIVEHVHEHISPLFDRPFAFFGHSMGASIAFELCHVLRPEARPHLAHLFVSGRGAPGSPATRRHLHLLPDQEFKMELARLKGTPRQVLENDEVMTQLLPMLRADFAALETYAAAPHPPLSVPLTSFSGSRDDIAPPSKMADWNRCTKGPFTQHVIDGDHFFVVSMEEAVRGLIARELSSMISPSPDGNVHVDRRLAAQTAILQ